MNTNPDETKKSEVATREESILSFWHEQHIFEKSLEKESPLGKFVFYDGPPFATGLPHYGHLLMGTVKDIIPRYKTMQGYHVPRVWGWDCHGLPIENLIEKELGLASKKDIEDYGIERFNEAARNSVLRYEEEWKRYVPRSGRWVDMENPYMSMDSSYMESVWWIFSELHKKGLTKQGFKAMHLCSRCETTLANFEVNQGYQDVTDISVTPLFELVDEPGTYLLAWTTTPWTLPGNVALAVGADISYIKVQTGEHIVILAKERAGEVLEGKEYTVLEEFLGSTLAGKAYAPLFDYYQQQGGENTERGWKVYTADFVTTEDGTGIVHIAPAFGSDDMELGRTENLPFVQHVAKNGSFIDDFASTTEGNSFKGMKVKAKGDWMSTDIEIIKVLAQTGKLFSKKKLVHSYPHCWRCDTPLLNYATSSWFVDVPELKEKMIAQNQKVRWVPEHVGEGRFGKWLDGAREWALSRSRFWGTPLPVWTNESGSEVKVVSSVRELLESMEYTKTRFLGMRHGESESNVSGIVNANPSVHNPLTQRGIDELRSELQELKKESIDLLVVSPLQRTMETAEIIKQELGLNDDQIIIDDRLRERSLGVQWENKLWSDAHTEEETTEVNAFWDARLADDAESIGDVYQRSMECLFDLQERFPGKTLLLVTHGGILKTMQYGCEYFGEQKTARDYYQTNPIPKNAELLELNFAPFPHNNRYLLDLHRPYIDQIVLKGEKGEPLKILGDVFDVWFDSGSMPYAQVHYPFEHQEDFESTRFPADFIAEGLDQTRGWFYVLSVLGTALFEKNPFNNVIVGGLVLAEDGKKMSKSLNNYPDPYHVFDTAGADALRLYLVSSPVVRAEEFSFSEKATMDVARKVMGRSRNILSLYELYKDSREHIEHIDSDHVLDQWMNARLRQVILEVKEGLDGYELDKASRPLFDFVDDFSTWYIRRSRDRFKSDDSADATKALATTRMVIKTFAQVLAPFTPFLAEELWQSLLADDLSLPESVHLSSWPELVAHPSDAQIIATMAKVRERISEGLQLRAEAGIKVRQVLQSFTSPLSDIPLEYHELILDELNVKELHDGELTLDVEVTPQLKREGYARELLRSIQSLRKEMNLEPQASVNMVVHTSEEGKVFIQEFTQELSATANIRSVDFKETEGTLVDLDEMKFTLLLEE